MLKTGSLAVISLLLLCIYAAGYWQWFARAEGLTDARGDPLGYDFIVYYAASKFALNGEPAQVYDTAKLTAQELAIAGPKANFGLTAWHYPPLFLLIVLPFALAPYLVTLFSWLGLTLAGYLALLQRLAPGWLGLLLALAYGGTFLNFLSGQNGFLTAGLMGAGLYFLDSKPRLAGALFGILCFKPQLALLAPLALICGRRFKALGYMTLSAGLLALLSLAIFGPETWLAFFKNISEFSDSLQKGRVVLKFKLLSPFASAILAGAEPGLARIVQALAGLTGAACVGFAFARNLPAWARGSIFCLAALLSSPHTYGYDLAILALPLAWLYSEGRNKGFLRFEPLLLGIGWLALPFGGPLLAQAAGVQLTPLLILLLILAVLRRSLGPEQKPGPA